MGVGIKMPCHEHLVCIWAGMTAPYCLPRLKIGGDRSDILSASWNRDIGRTRTGEEMPHCGLLLVNQLWRRLVGVTRSEVYPALPGLRSE